MGMPACPQLLLRALLTVAPSAVKALGSEDRIESALVK